MKEEINYAGEAFKAIKSVFDCLDNEDSEKRYTVPKTDFDEFIITRRDRYGGEQVIFRFENYYGASVVHHSGSYGLELAVLHYYGAKKDDWNLCYATPVSNDVLGHLSIDKLNDALKQLKELKKKVKS